VPVASAPKELTLALPNLRFADLFSSEGLESLHFAWLETLEKEEPALGARYRAYQRSQGTQLSKEEESQLLVELAPVVSRFVVQLFGCEAEWSAQQAAARDDLVVMRFKDEFVRRRAFKRSLGNEAQARKEGDELLVSIGAARNALGDERQVARVVCDLLDREIDLKKRPSDDPELVAARSQLATLEAWVLARRQELEPHWLSLRLPHATPDALNLVELRRPSELKEKIEGPQEKHRRRDGFRLTDRRMAPEEVMAEVDYCLYCHDRQKDSCSQGLKEKSGALKENALGVELGGCPLDERISEMHSLRRAGDSVGALALICIDNPMLPGTGHRICNDCMKACVYQKQQPVNIPQVETSVLTDVLALPYGFEIYGLLTRWNPLNVKRPYPLPYRGEDILVVGLGPAGYTLAHHLLNEGFGVVGIDGLKLEPLPSALVGDPQKGLVPAPLASFQSIYGELDERISTGFGGVSEYGITVRWDKNFLQLLYATLARRNKFRAYGGVRFGGTMTLDDAWQFGFKHVAIAVGAGRPTVIELKNNLIRGVRKASDFLMALQLTGAYKKSSLANLQVRLPAIVIGGGLTGIDTATELLAYYVVQVEKMLVRYERLVERFGHAHVEKRFDPEEQEVLGEFLAHGRAIREERRRAATAHEEPNFQPLLDAWGGVSLIYRKRLADSPAYRLNHEEVEKFLEEGVRFIECMSPVEAQPDEHGAVRSVVFERQRLDASGAWHSTGELVEVPARTVCIAAGTSPNTIYEKEHPGTFQLDKKGFFAPYKAERDESGKVVVVPDANGFFTSYVNEGRTVSYYGDSHPRYAGSVVKAMASAKHGFAALQTLFGADSANARDAAVRTERERAFKGRIAELESALQASVVAVNRLTHNIVEVVVRAPLAARRFEPGQFFRLQNFETESGLVEGTRLAMEGLALTGAWTDPEKGLLSLIALEMGGSSRLCSRLRVGEPVVVMGPTGTPTEIPRGEVVLLAGGGLGNAVLFSIGKALRTAGCKVLYFAAYRSREDIFKVDEIEAASDQVIWSVDRGAAFEPRRSQDRSFVGNVVEAMVAYAEGQLGKGTPLKEVSRLIAIGSDRMMRAVKEARHGVLASQMRRDHVGVASINSPMQCMMKEVCAQCLQKHVDPRTGKETLVFSCSNQDQDLDHVDFDNLAARLRANTVQEKLTNLWLDHLLAAS
jgi:NADPH-dependent glutamate synthase beta subunit-like oxidoreductase/NAD(P)H-flavin reductase